MLWSLFEENTFSCLFKKIFFIIIIIFSFTCFIAVYNQIPLWANQRLSWLVASPLVHPWPFGDWTSQRSNKPLQFAVASLWTVNPAPGTLVCLESLSHTFTLCFFFFWRQLCTTHMMWHMMCKWSHRSRFWQTALPLGGGLRERSGPLKPQSLPNLKIHYGWQSFRQNPQIPWTNVSVV